MSTIQRGRRKLTDREVAKLRAGYQTSGQTMHAFAVRVANARTKAGYPISATSINDALRGDTYAHVGRPA